MAKARSSGRLTAKTPAETAAPPVAGADLVDFPDAISYIRSLGTDREGVEYNIRVYKVDSSGRGVKSPQQFLFPVELEELPNLETQLAQLYEGGGIFKVVVRADGLVVKSAQLDIAPRPGYVPPRPSFLAAAAPVVAAPADHGGDRNDQFLQMMARNQEAADRRMETLIAAIVSKPEAKQPTVLEQIQLLNEIQKLTPKGAQENSMELFEKGMKFAQTAMDAGGGGGGGATWMDLLKEFLASGMAKDILTAAAQAAPAIAQPGQAQFPPHQPTAPLISPDNPLVAQAMDTLLRQAAAGVDPKFVAAQAFDHIPPAFVEELEAQDDVVGFIIHRFPQAAVHRPWLTALVAEMWSEEVEQEKPSPTLAGPDASQQNGQLPQA